MSKEWFVIELPNKELTYKGTKRELYFDNNGVQRVKIVDHEYKTREEFIACLQGFMETRIKTAKIKDMQAIMNFIKLTTELSEDEPVITIDEDDRKYLEDGFEAQKPDERAYAAYRYLPDLFNQILHPKKQKEWDEENGRGKEGNEIPPDEPPSE